MEIKKAFLVLVDISGYTKFIHYHKTSLIHAEKIISELLECIIRCSNPPLVLNKLQGDAALFYTEDDGQPDAAHEVLQKVVGFMDTFRRRERELVSECDLCSCDACRQADRLKLKAIVHYGEVAIKKIQEFKELAGEEVILVHRLLKNSIKKDEYLLLTESFYKISGGLPERTPEWGTESYPELGKINRAVYFWNRPEGEQPATPKSWWEKVIFFMKMATYTMKRRTGMKPLNYDHLPG